MKRLLTAALVALLVVLPAAAAKSITVTGPAAGNVWQLGSHHMITWTYASMPASTPIRIVLWHNGTKVDNIALGLTVGQGSCDWVAGTHQSGQAQAGSDYVVRIRAEDNSAMDDSGSFALSNAPQLGSGPQPPTGTVMPKPPTLSLKPIRITSPKAGDTVDPFNSVYIRWAKSGQMDANVSVTLLRNGASVATLASSTPNSGLYTWEPQALNPDPGLYKVRVKTLDGVNEDTSEPFTMQEAGGIDVVSPHGGEIWANNSSHAVTWSRTGNIRTVTILLLRNTIIYQTLAQDIDAKLLTKTFTFIKSPDDGAEPKCYQVYIKNSSGHWTEGGCFTVAGDPDLAITHVNYPSYFTLGTPMNFTVTIKNIGTVPSHPCQGDFRHKGVVQKTFSVPAVDPGMTTTVSFTWNYAGPGSVTITVDTGNVNIEPDKANNVWANTFMASRN